jgi:hypothetical protein
MTNLCSDGTADTSLIVSPASLSSARVRHVGRAHELVISARANSLATLTTEITRGCDSPVTRPRIGHGVLTWLID